MAEGDVVMTKDMSSAARILIAAMQGGLERKRRIWRLREEVARYKKYLAAGEAALAVEEAEAEAEEKFARQMLDAWRAEIESCAEPAPTTADGLAAKERV